jgi:hypothetical protein
VFRGDPELWKESGADMFAPDLAAAVEALRGLKE